MKTFSLKSIYTASILSICLLATVLILNAFTKEKALETNNVIPSIWYFHGNSTDSRLDSTKYSLSPDPNKPCEGQEEEVCTLSAPANGAGYPDMSAIATGTSKVKERINDAFASTPSTNETVTALREKVD
ncbi:hypothetical protein ACFRAE_08925 [Sphingobacterium sp. HJSM2_6]|uniref:hypothetical protein n=1 Tax=Sphingobacterium sp. HJSM2_6 TaxID=3366264 RepID=UPI003BEC96D0